MNPDILIQKWIPDNSPLRNLLINHSHAVANKAVRIAHHLHLEECEIQFIYEASILHDIGISYTDAPSIHCYGNSPYICHGYLGHDMILSEGFPRHALVCERHTGTGITLSEVIDNQLPVPKRDYLPLSIPEQIIAYSDKFFSKEGDLQLEKDLDAILKDLQIYGPDKASQFLSWHSMFMIS